MTTAAGDALRASSIPQPANTPGKTDWFVHDRFGLFIHWGIYAMAARHEWVKQREQITDEGYQPYFDHFNPDLYDPDEWAAAAKDAGMKYAVITSKHHDGFCLWDSQFTDYKARIPRPGAIYSGRGSKRSGTRG